MFKKLTRTGIIPLFRIFVVIRLLWAGLFFISSFQHPKVFQPGLIPIFSILEGILLVGYLSSSWLEDKLKKAYLPIGLAVATLGPWVENVLMLSNSPNLLAQISEFNSVVVPETGRLLLLASQLQLAFSLLIPIILISWRYSLKVMFWVVGGLAVIDFAQYFVKPLFGQEFFTTIFGAILFRSGMFLLIGFVVNRLASEQKQQNLFLSQANRQLTNYATTLEQLAVSRERNRLAREMHDTLAHTLSALAVNLEAVNALWQNDAERAKEILDQSLQVTRNGLVETRRAIQSLRAGPLDDLGLGLSLKQMAESYAERDHLKWIVDLPETVIELKPDLEQCIYRIAEEGLRNIGRHAAASSFEMKLIWEDGRIEFELTDDGRGFDVLGGGVNNRFGIQGMKERAEAVGGELTISSIHGQGTRLHFKVEGLGE